MANRHLARSVVLQTLFEWDFRNYAAAAAEESLVRNAAETDSQGKAPVGDDVFMRDLLKGVLARRTDLDMVIEKAAPEWPIARIAPVDRNVLRLGLYELLFADRGAVPAKVAINEAIELAKNYGGEHSGRFVNGVLGAVYKELGEPGKDETSKKKKDVPYDELPQQLLGGAVVYARNGGEVYLAFVHDIFGHWTLSKGKIGDSEETKGESVEEGTIREIKEELGLTVTLVEQLGENEYVANDPKTGKKRKKVTYFLAESTFEPLKLEQKGGLDDARWFRLQDALDLNFYEDTLPLITKAVQSLAKAGSKKPAKAK